MMLIALNVVAPPQKVRRSHEGDLISVWKGDRSEHTTLRATARRCLDLFHDPRPSKGYLAIGPYDLIIQVEATNDEALATYLLSLASKGNVRTTTLKLFGEAEFDKIAAAVA